MAKVGVRELKQRTSTILRRVRERGEEVEVTFRGRVVARIVPATRRRAGDRELERRAWRDIDRVADEIGARWPKGVTAVRAVREARRG
jgi:prevent-host-death family protein